jgi:serine protease AprX
MRLTTHLIMIAALAMTTNTVSAAVQPDVESKIGSQLRQQIGSTRTEDGRNWPVMIWLKDAADLSQAATMDSREQKGRFVHEALVATATRSQRSIIARLKEMGLRHQPYWIVNMIAVFEVTAAQIEELAAREDVLRVVADPRVRIMERSDALRLRHDSSEALGANIARTGADQVWKEFGFRGEGIVIGGQDTGVDWTHPALKPSYRGWNGSSADHNYSWHDSIRAPLAEAANPCGYATQAPCDDDAHGTHTHGTMTGDDGAGNQIGMAPGAKWIACRNMDQGYGSPSTYIECFQFFLAPWPYGGDPMKDGNPAMAPHVINNSWGCPPNEGCEGDEFLPAIKALEAAGTMVIVSAGNEGSGCGSIKDGPAWHSLETFSVGAMSHSSGNIANFSARGPSRFDNQVGPDLVAPGVSVRSSIPGGGYSGAQWSGTSMAGPHVVGAVALLWQADPSLVGKISATTAVLTSTAEPKTSTQTCGGVAGDQIPNNTWGWGILNVYNAVRARRP